MIAPGVWRNDAYGWLLEVGPASWTRWQLVGEDAYAEERGALADLDLGFDRVAVDRDRAGEVTRMVLRHAGEITPYSFTREAELPVACAREYRSDDPLRTFDALATIFRDHYAFFAERRVDWDAACASARATLGASAPAPDRLFDALTALLAPLEDNHVTLDTRPERSLFDRDHATPPGAPRAWKCDRIAALRAAIARDLGITGDNPDFWATARAMQRVVADDLLRGRGEEDCNGFLHWGEIAPGVGYLALLRLFGFAATHDARAAADLPRDRVAGARFLAADRAALAAGLDRALAALSSTRALVVDLRMNGGGFDALALDFAARFADRERLAFTKAPVLRGKVLDRAEIRIAPRDDAYTRPLFVLTSRRTGSAAEILVLALSALPQAKRIGDPTLGILSDNLYKRLPNGWEVGLSNERYETPGGELYEGTGIPPHFPADVWVEGDLRGGYRRAIDTALTLLR
jgi:carboxyl-terminal processing protease